MAIALRKGTSGQLQQIQAGESVDADKFERLSASGNLLVGSALGANELQLGQTTSLVRVMGDLQSDGYAEITEYAEFVDMTAPANPGAGRGRLYKKTGDDGIFWKPDAAGPELDLTSGGVSGLTDNRALRADGATGIQDSGITVDDSNRVQEVKVLASDSVYNNGNSTASFSWTLSNGQHQEVTLNADSVAMTIVSTGITGPSVFTLRVKQDATGSRAITSASISGGTVYYTGTTEPTFPSGANAQCEMVCKFDGTDCVCQVTGVLTAWT